MKLDGMKCPYCGNRNTRAWKIDNAGIRDDSAYELQEKEFGENRILFGSTDNIIYDCVCDDCGKYFSTMALLEVKTKKTITRKRIEELMGLKVSEVES